MPIRKSTSDSKLDEAIDNALSELASHELHSEEYSKAADQLTKLYEIRQKNKPDTVSKDALINALSGLAGILVIVAYEQRHVMTSRALSFIKLGK